MRFLSTNVNFDDCMVVAIYNALIAIGKDVNYEEVLNLCLKKQWYVPGKSFQCKYLEDAFSAFDLKCKLVTDYKKTKKIFKSVVNHNKVYLFFRPHEWSHIPGHGMVASKGNKGVHLFNPFHEGTGWKTLCKEIHSGYFYLAIEIMRTT